MTDAARRYYRSGNVLWVINVAWGLAVPALFLFTGLSARLRAWAVRVGRRWFFAVGCYLVAFALISSVLDLPLVFYQEYVRAHAYGLSNQTLSKWAGDAVTSLMIGLGVLVLVGWVPFLVLRTSPRRWWLYTSLLMVPFLFLILFVTPLWIDPLFNDFGPMKDRALEQKILALADRAGIEGGDVFEVDKTVDTKTVNAYVTGVLGTKRIVLWDTIIATLDEDELLFVMGHEMGHYVLGHVTTSFWFLSAGALVALYAVHRTAGWLIARHRARFGFDDLADVASLPLILLVANLVSLVALPAGLAFSRHQEHEADRFGLEITQRNRPAATAFVKLQTENLQNPRPGLLFKLWRATHPPVGERIDFCNSYRPWTTGAPLRYGHYFRDEHRP